MEKTNISNTIKKTLLSLLVIVTATAGVYNFQIGEANAAVTFVQLAERSELLSNNSVTTANFTNPVGNSNLMVVWVWYNSSTQSVSSITDTAGNTYAKAVGPTVGSGVLASWSQEIWYAKNIVGGTAFNVTATFSGIFNGRKSITAHEYSGADLSTPLDITAFATGTSADASSGAAITNFSDELIFGAALFEGTGGSGVGFTQRSFIQNNASEDKNVLSTGSNSVTFNNSAQTWIVQMASFRAAGATTPTPTPPPSSDTTAPIISAVAASSITSSGATITWTTNEASDTQVEYGLTTAYGNPSVLNTSLVTAHSQTISGLSASTLWHYRVKSKDSSGNLATSGDFTFTTTAPDTVAPSVPTSLSATAVSSSQINLSWTASTDNVGVTGYGIFRNGSEIATSATNFFSNTGLTPSTTYTYTVSARDASGNESGQSASVGVTTQAISSTPDTTAPVISAVAASSITSSGATITWTTNEASDTQVEYGLTTAYGNPSVLNTSLVTAHSQTISGLTASTLWHYRVKSKDSSGNLATSGDFTFTTTAPGGGGTNFPIGWTNLGATSKLVQTPTIFPPDFNGYVYANSSAQVIDAYGGGAFDVIGNRAVIWGGGHQDSKDNSVYALSLLTGAMTRITEPSHTMDDGVTSVNGNSGQQCTDTMLNTTGPGARHTYDAFEYIPSLRAVSSFGGSICSAGGDTVKSIWNFDLANLTWTKATVTGANPSTGFWQSPSAMARWHTNESKLLLVAPSNGTMFLCTTTSLSSFSCVNKGDGPGGVAFPLEVSLAFDPVDNLFYAVGPSNNGVLNLGTPKFYKINAAVGASSYTVTDITASVPAGCNGIGTISYPMWDWEPDLGLFVSYNTINRTVYTFNPNGGGTPSCSVLTVSGTAPVATCQTSSFGCPNTNGGSGRFRYVADCKCFVLILESDQNSFILKLTASTPPPPDTTAPVISAVAASSVTSSGATITWTTDESSDTQVEYGLTTAYGNSTILNTSPVTAHSQTISGLSASTFHNFLRRHYNLDDK
ncbi:MAG: hypothetical protein HYX20_00820 [Candidatus Yanofskybacteria bacterium]|nr:hypothetical protein [Candidatus Yanofskybacteria bacterium]